MGVQVGKRKDSSLLCQKEEATLKLGLEEVLDLTRKLVGVVKW